MRDSRGRGAFVADEVFCFRVQVGDNSTTHRYTPVSVSGLGSGVAMIALGGVRVVVIASGRYVVLERRVCIRLIALLLCCGTRMCEMGWRNVRRRRGGVCDAVVCRHIPVRCPAAARCHAGEPTGMAK